MSIAEKQDDQYITERIYGIAYGCVLRCNDIAMIKEVALHVYSKMFEHNDPPCNILLRGNISCVGSLHSVIVIGEIKDSHVIPVARYEEGNH